MNQNYMQKFLLNAETQFKQGSTYVIGVGLGFLWLLSQWPDLASTVDKLTGNHGYGAGIAILVTALVTKFRPSNAVSSQLETALVEIARLQANSLLQKHGVQAEIPQAAAVSGLPPPPVAAVVAGALPAVQKAPTTVREVDLDPTSPQPLTTLSPPAMPIDERMLLSLVQEYLKQRVSKST